MRLHLVLAVALAGCGDNIPGNVLERLQGLPGVHDVTEEPTQAAGFTYYVMHFEQPVDHANPGGQKFLQRVSLLHKDPARPMIEFTSGYADYYKDRIVELTSLLGANQVSIEHRYFGESRPEPADWSKLTIEQMANDQHAITEALRTFYDGAFITAGGSKGGMTAVYYRRFYPDDVDGTVPYVAPISFAAPDLRYAAFLDTIGPEDCRLAVRAVATEMLANRRDAITARAQSQAAVMFYEYTRIPLGPAVESAVFNLEWSFWQYAGVGYCNRVPPATADDDMMWDFLNRVSPVSENTDAKIAEFEAYYHQAYHQLGYPDGGATYLDPYLMYTDADYLTALPTEQPAYDGGAAMMDIDQWVRESGERLLFIYGAWDPWTGGQFELGNAQDSLLLVQAEGTHGSRILGLSAADREAAFDKLESWTGVTPSIPTARSARDDVRTPRMPPAITRALRARRLSP